MRRTPPTITTTVNETKRIPAAVNVVLRSVALHQTLGNVQKLAS